MSRIVDHQVVYVLFYNFLSETLRKLCVLCGEKESYRKVSKVRSQRMQSSQIADNPLRFDNNRVGRRTHFINRAAPVYAA